MGEVQFVSQFERSSVGFTDRVISLLQPHEKDNEGFPKVIGLRRISQVLIGKIIRSESKVVHAERDISVVEHTYEFETPEGRETYTGVADCSPANAGSEHFARFPTAYASTRAKGRALNEALQLTKIASEEKMVKDENSIVMDVGGYIKPVQITAINKFCRDLNINAEEFLQNGGSGLKYKVIKDIREEAAFGMLDVLSSFLRNPEEIPNELQGYNKNWKEVFGGR